MKIILACVLVTTLGAALAGCGDDTGGSGGGGSDDDTTSSPSSSANNSAGNGSTGSGSEAPTTCAEVCEYTPIATDAQGDCVGENLTLKGYDVAGTPACVDRDLETAADCDACYAVLEPTDADCVAAWEQCFN